MPVRLFVGTARCDITPPVGARLLGYEPGRMSEGIRDPLDLSAVAFQYGEQKAVLISMALVEVNTSISNALRQAAASACGVDTEYVIVCATHTHTAPNTYDARFADAFERCYVSDTLIPAAADAARGAMSHLVRAEMAIGTTKSFIGVNRCQIGEDGVSRLGQNPWGVFDPTLTVLAFRDQNRRGIVNIAHYGAHCTAAGASDFISRDWAGIMVDRLEEVSGTPTAFVNGAEGNVGPRLTNGQTTGDIKMMEELGGQAASDCVRAFRNANAFHDADLHIITGDIALPVRPIPEMSVLDAEIDRLEKVGKNSSMQCARLRAQRALLASGQSALETIAFRQTLLAVGNAVFIPFPTEPFSEIALRLREHSPFAHTLCISNANGSIFSYLPTREAIARGGFEVDCFLYESYDGNVCAPTDDADDRIIRANLALLRAL